MIVGLTGGIASGKTTVSDHFASLGVPVIDADIVAREVVGPNSPGLAALVERAGPEILAADGTLDRRALRDQIFRDSALRKDVEAILHPRIRERMNQQASDVETAYCIMAIPLLVEGGRHLDMDRILVVDVPIDVQRARLMARDGSSESQVNAILDAQTSREQRLRVAHDVIDNTGTLASLKDKVERLHRHYLKLARRSSNSTTG